MVVVPQATEEQPAAMSGEEHRLVGLKKIKIKWKNREYWESVLFYFS